MQQLALGEDFVFTVTAAEYDNLKRSYNYRWQKHDRLGRAPAYQFQGPGETVITLSGTHHVYETQDIAVPNKIKAAADAGEPLALLAGIDANNASYEGLWIINNISFDETDILSNGVGQTVAFTVSLKLYGEDE